MKVPTTHRTLTGRSPAASEGRSMKYRTLGRIGIEGGDVRPGDERLSGP
jgi:hypothetical protein